MSYKHIKERLPYLGVILMFMLPVFPSGLKPKIIGIFVLFSVLSISRANFKFNHKRFLINSSIYFLLAISILYSENMEYALNKLETMSSLVIFPLAFACISSEKTQKLYNDRHRYMFIYVVVIAILNLVFFAYHFGHYKFSLTTHYITVIRLWQGDFNIHPIYLSMHVSIAIIFTFFLIKNESNRKKLAVLFLLDGILIAFLFIMLKKSPILALGICLTLFVMLQNKKNIWIFYTSTVLITVITIMGTPKLKTKFAELFKIENIESGNLTSSNIRYSIYDYAIKTFKKAPLIGHGIGDFNNQLAESYKGSPILYQNRFNTHNQYLSFVISIGLIGLMGFILIIINIFLQAVKFNNIELILILVFYCLMMLFENILEREDGVVFFSLFINFLSLFSIKQFKEQDVF